MANTVLITGSSKGLGKALAKVFSKNKYNVIIHGRNKSDLERVKKEVENAGVICDVVIGDIRDKETIEKLAEIAKKRDISILINNAGIISNQLLDASEEEINEVLDTNLIAPIKLTNKICPLFKAKKKGMIININSTGGLPSNEPGSIYHISKCGLKSYSDSLRALLKKDYNIRVLEVYPGGMNTHLHDRLDKEWAEKRRRTKPLMKADEVAELIFSLTKDNSIHVDYIKITRRDL